MSKRGFTLIEILVVLLVMIAIFTFYSISYRHGIIVRENERARGMFMELTNAARLFNETYPNSKIYGTFGESFSSSDCLGCVNPCQLFKEYWEGQQDVQDTISPFALRLKDWGISNIAECASGIDFKGYTFVLCNPVMNSDSAQPHSASAQCEVNGEPRFAVMLTPGTVTFSKYAGKNAWMTSGYELKNDYL